MNRLYIVYNMNRGVSKYSQVTEITSQYPNKHKLIQNKRDNLEIQQHRLYIDSA